MTPEAQTWKIMPCPQHAGKHPFHDHRYVVTSDAELSYGHDPRDESWGLSSGAIICQMRDGPPERAHLVAAAPQMRDKCAELETELTAAKEAHASQQRVAIQAMSELTAAKAECNRLYESSPTALDALTAELTRLRAELAVAENWVDHHSKHADDLIGENVKLRSELKELSQAYELNRVSIDELDADRARAARAEAELATEKDNRNHLIEKGAKIETELAAEREKVKLREAWLCGHTDGIDCGSGQRSTTDFVTFDQAEAKGHVAKYKGSWTTEGWYRAVPVGAPVALAATKEGA